MESEGLSLTIIIFCIIMSAYFSATETAFSSLNRIRIKNLSEKGNKKAALVMKLSENYDVLLSTILIGNNIVNIASAALATLIFVKFFGEEAGASLSTVITTVVVLIFGEVSPKSIAKESPEKFAMFSAPLLNLFVILLTPLNFFFKQWKKLLSLLFKNNESNSITEEELLTMVEEAELEGGINKQEGTLIKSAIEFSELEAVDILTPRVDVVAISSKATKEEAAEKFRETAFSRLPVYEETIDDIIGIIYQKDFHNHVYHHEKQLSDIIRPAFYTTKNKKIGELLKELQTKKSHIAIVIDEFGGTIGIVTMEDILEELVGEIWDEHDTVEHEIEKISDNEYIVQGKVNIEDMFEILGKEAEFSVQTVSGWIMDILENLPKEGQSFEFEDLKVIVLKMDKNRIKKVKIIKLPKSSDEELEK